MSNKDLTTKERELVLKVSKEIVIKFIEMGKVTPSSFPEVFAQIFSAVENSIKQQ